MTARMALLAAAVATPLTSCASLTGTSALCCDGSARRPLNRSLWDWDSAGSIAVQPIEAPAPLPPESDEPIIRKGEIDHNRAEARAFNLPVFEIAASTRRCGGADHG